jgi:hypothetical protein
MIEAGRPGPASIIKLLKSELIGVGRRRGLFHNISMLATDIYRRSVEESSECNFIGSFIVNIFIINSSRIFLPREVDASEFPAHVYSSISY